MEGIFVLLGLVIVIAVALFVLFEKRWKRFVEEVKTDPSSGFKLEQIESQPSLSLERKEVEAKDS